MTTLNYLTATTMRPESLSKPVDKTEEQISTQDVQSLSAGLDKFASLFADFMLVLDKLLEQMFTALSKNISRYIETQFSLISKNCDAQRKQAETKQKAGWDEAWSGIAGGLCSIAGAGVGGYLGGAAGGEIFSHVAQGLGQFSTNIGQGIGSDDRKESDMNGIEAGVLEKFAQSSEQALQEIYKKIGELISTLVNRLQTNLQEMMSTSMKAMGG